MSAYINTEAIESASYRLQRAADEANRAADRLDYVLHQLRILTEEGYGNNVSRLIELLSKEGREP